jgi:hypothetical protein
MISAIENDVFTFAAKSITEMALRNYGDGIAQLRRWHCAITEMALRNYGDDIDNLRNKWYNVERGEYDVRAI